MKKLMIAFLPVLLACGNKETNIDTSALPADASFAVTKQEYNAYNGKYTIYFDITNKGSKTMKYPAFHAEMFTDDKKVSEADGGAAGALEPGQTGQGTFSQIFPDGKPDKVKVTKSM